MAVFVAIDEPTSQRRCRPTPRLSASGVNPSRGTASRQHYLGDMDFGGFHRIDLPARIANGRGALAAADVAPIGPLAIRLAETAETFTYVPSGETIEIVEGDADARCV